MSEDVLRRSAARLAVAEVLLSADETFGREISNRSGVAVGGVDRVLKTFAEYGWIASRWEYVRTANKGARPPRRYWRVVERKILEDFHRGAGAWSGTAMWRTSDGRRSAVDRRALEEERARLVTRIAKIDEMLGTVEDESARDRAADTRDGRQDDGDS